MPALVTDPAQPGSPESNGQPSPRPMPKQNSAVCPYCGASIGLQASDQCNRCKGLLDPWSRQASQNAMGAWFIRDEGNPFRPGCSRKTLLLMIERGKVGPETVVRGPSTRQFWIEARLVPGIAHLFGACQECGRPAQSSDQACAACHASFVLNDDRQHLGLAEVRPIMTAAPITPLPTVESPRDKLVERLTPAPSPAFAASDSDAAQARDEAARLLALRRKNKAGNGRTLLALALVAAVFILVAVGLFVLQSLRNGAVKPAQATTKAPAQVPSDLPKVPQGSDRPPASTPGQIEPPAQSAPVEDPQWQKIESLIETDTIASLQEAIALLEPMTDVEAPPPAATRRLEFARKRLELLEIRRHF